MVYKKGELAFALASILARGRRSRRGATTPLQNATPNAPPPANLITQNLLYRAFVCRAAPSQARRAFNVRPTAVCRGSLLSAGERTRVRGSKSGLLLAPFEILDEVGEFVGAARF